MKYTRRRNLHGVLQKIRSVCLILSFFVYTFFKNSSFSHSFRHLFIHSFIILCLFASLGYSFFFYFFVSFILSFYICTSFICELFVWPYFLIFFLLSKCFTSLNLFLISFIYLFSIIGLSTGSLKNKHKKNKIRA